MKGTKVVATAVLSMFLFNVGLGGLAASDIQDDKPAVEITIDNGQEPVEISFGDQEKSPTTDKSLYGVNRLLEKVQLYLVFSPEDRAELFIKLAQERLVEAQAMDERGEDELVELMVKEYMENLVAAQENLEEVQIDLKAYNEVLTKIEMDLSINLDLLENIKDKLPELEDNINIIKDNLKVIKDTIIFIDKLEEVVKEDKIKEEKETEKNEDKTNNYGNGELRFVQILAEKANMTTEEVMKLRASGLGWGNVAKELGISLGTVARELDKYLIVLDEEVEDIEVDLEKAKGIKQENIEENITQLVKKIQEYKDKDIRKRREELEQTKEKLNKKQDNDGKVPALVEEMLKEKNNSK